jgi:hypothetical protein
MKRTNLFTVAVLASAIVAAPAVYAAPANIPMPIHAMFSKTKMIKLSLRNDTKSEMDLKIGDKVVPLAPGKTLDLSLPAGTRILANNDTPNHASGSLIEEVVSEHNGATISIH